MSVLSRRLVRVGLVLLLVGGGIAVALVMRHRNPSPTKTIPGADKAPAGMVRVEAGPFWQGCPERGCDCLDGDRPGRKVTLGSYFIDRLETTVGEYKRCVEAGACPNPEVAEKAADGFPQRCNFGTPDRDRHPMNCVHWLAASQYCAWVGKRLPTEAEWEKAARGDDGRLYPWGDEEPDCRRAIFDSLDDRKHFGCGEMRTWPVGSRPAGASPYGALDMLGNVAEWTNDVFVDEYYRTAPSHDPQGGARGALNEVLKAGVPNRGYFAGKTNVAENEPIAAVVRSCAWNGKLGRYIRRFVFTRQSRDPLVQGDDVGFRCARSVASGE